MGRILPIAKEPKIALPPPSPPVAPPTPEKTDADEQTRRRVQALLEREHGRSGTVVSGARGVLSENDLRPARKTLLGE